MNGIVHGGRLDAAIAEFGGRVGEWLDLSTGINPWPWPVGDFSPECFTRLPGEAAEKALLNVARTYYQLRDEHSIVAANGTQALIQLLPSVLEGVIVEIISPTYGEHAHCWRMEGRQVREIGEPAAVSDKSDIVVIGNPNNPDCRHHEPEELRGLAKQLNERGGVLVVDEAFCDVTPELSLVPSLPDNAIVLRSFGKFFGLAGVRLGFAIGNHEIANQLHSKIGPWAVSGSALEIGRHALQNDQWIGSTRERLHAVSKRQASVLEDCGLAICGNATLFIETSHERAPEIHRKLLAEQILVRDFPDRPDRLRYGLCPDDASMSRLANALKWATGT